MVPFFWVGSQGKQINRKLELRLYVSYTLCGMHAGCAELQCRAEQLRAHAIDVLAAPLGGDKLAAEYLLLQLISR